MDDTQKPPGIVDQWMAFRDSGGQSNEMDDMVILESGWIL